MFNSQGDIVGLLDSTCALVVEYKYDAWGKPIATTGNLADTLGKRNPFRYRGYVYDEESELYYLDTRYYSSTWMRFVSADDYISTDPENDAIIQNNLYQYAVTFQRSVDRETDIRVFSILYLLENLSSPLPVTIGDIKAEGSVLERQKTLKNIRSKAHLSMEEQGTNILYLSLQLSGNLSISCPYASNDSKTFTKKYTNPIISFGTRGISIYDNSEYSPESQLMFCSLSFVTSSFAPLVTWFDDCACKYIEQTNISNRGNSDLFEATIGDFVTYAPEKTSCFAALAAWCERLGYTKLIDIYNDATYPNGLYNSNGYKKYTAWPMFKTYYRYWTFDKLT